MGLLADESSFFIQQGLCQLYMLPVLIRTIMWGKLNEILEVHIRLISAKFNRTACICRGEKGRGSCFGLCGIHDIYVCHSHVLVRKLFGGTGRWRR